MGNFKNSHYIFFLILAGLLVFSFVYASALSDYQAALSAAKAQYQSAMAQAQSQYQSALNTANQNYQSALNTSANSDSAEASYEDAISQAQAVYEAAAKSAYQDYLNWRKTAWQKYSGQTTTVTTPSVSSTITINFSDFQTVLTKAIANYFSNTGTKLTASELKDLLAVYPSTSVSTINLSGTGTYSGEKLIDIYNKVKGVNSGGGGGSNAGGSTSTGQYSQQVATAVKLDQPSQPTPQSYGLFVFPTGAYTISQGATVYFLIDPSGFGIQVPSNLVAFNLGDYAQGGNLNAYVYELDSSDNLWTGSHAPPSNPFQASLYNNNGGFSDHYYQSGKKYLIKVQETMNIGTTRFNIWWNAD